MFRKDFVAIALLLSAAQVSADPLIATQYGDFDRYVLALSWQTGFCQSMQDRNRSEPEECRLQQELSNKADFLTVHGLWPSLPKSIAARGWTSGAGCALAVRPALFPICRKQKPGKNVGRLKPGSRWKWPISLTA